MEKQTIGHATLYRADCLDVIDTMPDGFFDALITDPPYCSGGVSNADRTNVSTTSKYVNSDAKNKRSAFMGDNKDQRALFAWLQLILRRCHEKATEDAVIGSFSDWRQLPLMSDIVQASGWRWRGVAVWDKTPSARPSRGGFRNQSEFLLWGTLPIWLKTAACICRVCISIE